MLRSRRFGAVCEASGALPWIIATLVSARPLGKLRRLSDMLIRRERKCGNVSVLLRYGQSAEVYAEPRNRRSCLMQAIRIPQEQWGKVWRVLVAAGPISRLSQEPVYLVSDRHIRLLRRKKLPFELIPPSDGHRTDSSHG